MYESQVLTLQEAALILKCHPKTLRLMAMEGKIPSQRVGKLWRFSRTKLQKWLDGDD
jgi:excisionase family DNA binding protein